MSKKPQPAPINLFDLVPSRTVEFEVDDAGAITLLRPKFIKGPFARWLQPRLRRPYYHVHLDERGTRVWNLIDGERTVAAILEALREQEGEMDQAEDRLAAFLHELEVGGMIEYGSLTSLQQPPAPQPDL